MAYLERSDFAGMIRGTLLDQITNFDDSKLDTAIGEAISFAKGHLNARYDIAAIFAASGTARNPIVLRHCKSIAVYYVHHELSPHKVPEMRINAYKEAVTWFEEVKDGLINQPDLPVVEDDETRSYIKFGGNEKRENHI